MSGYPTENSLVINTTHKMLSSLESDFRQKAATSPTRREEKGSGYDVQLSFALRLQFQYKRPQNNHSRRGVTFDVNGEQVGTLCFRDDTQTPYLACPAVEHRGQLKNSLKNCFFVNAHPVSEKTSRLYIPEDYGSNPSAEVTAKIKNGDYYTIPDRAIKRWDEMIKGIRSRNLGLTIRKNSRTTPAYQNFVNRLKDLNNLYYSQSPRTDGGQEGPPDDYERVLNEEAAYGLINHAMDRYEEWYDELDDMPTFEEEEKALWKLIEEKMGQTTSPAVHRIRRSRDVIFEDGNKAQRLELGYGS